MGCRIMMQKILLGRMSLKVSSERGGIQKILKRYAYILHEEITVHNVGSEIAKIMTKISNLRTSFHNYGIRESLIGGEPSSLN